MFTNYIKTALRIALRQKGYSLINIVGLAVGLASCLIILLYVRDEQAYDTFQSNAGRLYRLNKVVTIEGSGTERHAITSGMMGPTLAGEYHEVEQSVRLMPWFSDVLMTVDEQNSKVSDVVIADSNFFSVFNFVLLQGDPRRALSEPMSVVLTKSTAQRFFGSVNPLGRRIHGFRNRDYTVTGIAEDPPAHSHIQFNALISWSSTVPGKGPLDMPWLNNWITQVNLTYLLLRKNVDVAAFENKLAEFMQRYLPQRSEQYRLYLQPFNDIYLHSTKIRFTGNTRGGDATYVYIFSAVALFVLLIACINFVNLSTAQASRRAREVGVRKILGSYRRQLISQFIGESVMFSFLSVLIALILVEALLPPVNSLLDKQMSMGLSDKPGRLLFLLAGSLLIGIAAGSYPAFLLSAFSPFHVFRISASGGKRMALARKSLTTAQFAITVVLIAGTLIVFRQMQFIHNKNLGFNKEQLLVLPIGNTGISDRFLAFKTELLRNPDILYAAGSNSIPGETMMSFSIKPEGFSAEAKLLAYAMRVDDDDLLKTYQMEMAAGRYFSPDHGTDSSDAVVINEALAGMLGWKEPVGRRLDISGELTNGRVIGVIRNFHMRSLHHMIEPMLIYFSPCYENLTLRLSGSNIPATLTYLNEVWQDFEPRYPFDYQFLDQKLDRHYRSESRLLDLLTVFSLLAVFIACLGLFALAAFTARRRRKEIGIRKVHGASVGGLILMLIKDFLRLVTMAVLIAWPAAYFLAEKWLQNFAYHTEPIWWIFLAAGSLSLIIALLTVSTQALRAAMANPVNVLRYE